MHKESSETDLPGYNFLAISKVSTTFSYFISLYGKQLYTSSSLFSSLCISWFIKPISNFALCMISFDSPTKFTKFSTISENSGLFNKKSVDKPCTLKDSSGISHSIMGFK